MPTLTKRWSCKFAIRPFLDDHLEVTRQHLRRWVDGEDETVRCKIQHASTLTYHPGIHRVDLQVSGQCLATTQFEITTTSPF